MRRHCFEFLQTFIFTHNKGTRQLSTGSLLCRDQPPTDQKMNDLKFLGEQPDARCGLREIKCVSRRSSEGVPAVGRQDNSTGNPTQYITGTVRDIWSFHFILSLRSLLDRVFNRYFYFLHPWQQISPETSRTVETVRYA